MARLYEEARRAGIDWLGVTDHISCRLNDDYLLAARREYDELEPKPGFLFGLEVSCLRRWDLERNDRMGVEGGDFAFHAGGPEAGELALYLPEELMEKLKPAYVIGGVHWPLGTPVDREAVIREYHRQYMFLAEHPRVDVVGHPWWFVSPPWWDGAWHDERDRYQGPPWFDDFGAVPESMHEELAAAARQNDTAVEINPGAIFSNPRYPAAFKLDYWDYLAGMKERGVQFITGSDSHADGYNRDRLPSIESEVERLGLTESHLWTPPAARDSAPTD